MSSRSVRTMMMTLALATTATVAQAADTTPSSPPPAAGIKAAQMKIDSGDFRGAIPILAVYTKDHPNDADGLNLMGYSLRKTGQFDLALQYYNRALTLMPKHLGVNEYLGELYAETGQIGKAKERLAVLQAACGTCSQELDLAAAIKAAEAKPKS
ncbi:MAG TPA: tetratricopeptide repeat protein [Stellaceae bacterium]|nr:tetratricopeptide repeat protein [Stellaceae bacterium]